MNKTILYYTSNREKPEFEEKIRKVILENSKGLPIVSVSQKPLSFGKNIYVGDVGHSYLNAFRQILIGARAIDTEYIIFAEADFLYPKEYFAFEPQGENLYRYSNVWIIFSNMCRKYRRKTYSIGAQIAKKQFIVNSLERYLEGQSTWVDGEYVVKDELGTPKKDYNGSSFVYFGGSVSCVSFKTGNAMAKSTFVLDGKDNRVSDLPHWGNVDELRRKYLYD